MLDSKFPRSKIVKNKLTFARSFNIKEQLLGLYFQQSTYHTNEQPLNASSFAREKMVFEKENLVFHNPKKL